jgi:rSAM/selenodomain-associated transferase 2
VRLSVVIPTLDEAERITESVSSAVGGADEVLVVDGGSRDGTPDRAEAAGARVIFSTPGRARQLGVGAEAAQGDIVLFLHADTQLPVGWDAAVRRALDDAAVVGGAFRFRLDERGLVFRLLEWGTRLRVALLCLPYGDQALFVRRSALDSIGGLPQVPIMEDLDLVSALKRRGRLVLLSLPATTSARRYREHGPLRTAARNLLAALAWACGRDRARMAARYRR